MREGDDMIRGIFNKKLKKLSEASGKCHKNDDSICINPDGYGDKVNMSIEVSEQQILEGQVKDARDSLKKTRGKYNL